MSHLCKLLCIFISGTRADLGTKMIGKGVLESIAEDKAEINQFLTSHKHSPTEALYVRVFSKAIIGGKTFFTKANRRVKKRNTYTVSYSSSSSELNYGAIEKFIQVDDHHLAVIQELITAPLCEIPVNFATAASQSILFQNYLRYTEGTRKLVFVHQIVQKCCNLSNNDCKYLTFNVNDIELE